MKRICAYMMAALLALSSVFCPAIPVLAEGEEIIDASGYGTMVEDVLTDRFSGMEPSQQEFIYVEAEDEFAKGLIGTMGDEEFLKYTSHVLTQSDHGNEETVDSSDVAQLPAQYIIGDSDEQIELEPVDNLEQEQNKNRLLTRMNNSMMSSSMDDGIMTAANTSVPGLYLDKKVTKANSDGSYTIQLEAYTTGTVTTTTKYIPADIILVLDRSGSMNSNNLGSVTRLSALKTAAKKFIDQVYTQATTHNVNHRLAIVTFGNGQQYQRFYDNNTLEVSAANYSYTGVVYINSDGVHKFRKYDVATAGYCDGSAMRSMKTEANRTQLRAAIDSITTDDSTATFPDLGLELANRVFANNAIAAGTERNRVIVVFSDGGPGWNSRWFDVNAAQRAITQANTAKNTYGASVYVVGVFSGANANTTGTNPGSSFTPSADYKQAVDSTAYTNDVTVDGRNYSYNNSYKNSVLKYDAILASNYTAYCNWLLQKISSNNGTVKNPSYYLSASSTTALNNIFETIANTVSKPTVSMSASTVIRDYMSDYFQLPAGVTASDVTIRTAKYSSSGTFSSELTDKGGATATVDPNTGLVSVTGFDFNKYFCSTTKKNTGDNEYGRKLIIRFNVVPKAGFLGGNNVPTNKTSTSGIYSDSTTPVATFPSPSVNVPIQVPDFAVQDKTVYYGTQVTPDELYTPYTPANATDDDYVTITYVKPDQAAISSANCTENLEYKIQVVAKNAASSSSVGPAQSTTVTAANTKAKTANVHVLVPEKTYNDTSIYLGQTADYTNNGADTAHTWIDQKGHTTYPAVTGTAPEVVFTYNPAEGAFETDTAVNVTATIGGAEATNAVSFKWTTCTENHGSLPKIASPHLGSEESPEFYVHILNNSLTITKTGLNAFVYDSGDHESAIFTVKEEGGKNRTWTVAINGNDSVTLDGLYAGAKYTVIEQNNWTWRYNNNDAHFKLLDEGTNNVFTFENVLREDKAWLNGDNYKNNVFGNGAVSPTESIPPAGN
ncbi:MAG: VWA domain-containing protein [Clostridia bacterium]|nr:VWA domain-containing protein [Clostridia bacterium]